VKPLGINLILYVDSGGTGVLECADRVKDMSRFAKSAPRVHEQWDRYHRSDALRGGGQRVQGECGLDPTRDNATRAARQGGIPESNHFSDFRCEGIVDAGSIDKTRILY
jgi:hypothetical protein